LHFKPAGLKRQARGFSINPSHRPSARSQAVSAARWMARSFTGGMALSALFSKACSFHTPAACSPVMSLAGAPAMMPSKSSG
jgi:hypothetical protein